MIDLGDRIEVHPKDFLHEGRGCFLEHRNPVVRVAPVFDLIHFSLEGFAPEAISQVIIFADTKIEEQWRFRMFSERRPLARFIFSNL